MVLTRSSFPSKVRIRSLRIEVRAWLLPADMQVERLAHFGAQTLGGQLQLGLGSGLGTRSFRGTDLGEAAFEWVGNSNKTASLQFF